MTRAAFLRELKAMSKEVEIDYEALIDRSIKDCQPIKALWSMSLR
jgi:hypothetical protein